LHDFGRRALRDLSHPERVVQLCHPDVRNGFPPLRTGPRGTGRLLRVCRQVVVDRNR
jgi:hypothetical protein